MCRTMTRAGVALVFLLCAGSSRVQATSYVGLGGGPATDFGTEITTLGSIADTLGDLGVGYGLEAQFGWESAKWIDIEGALRYSTFSMDHALPNVGDGDADVITGYSLIGFEGGIRVHMERVLTNTTPYIRGGLASYSPSIELNGGGRQISNDTVLGYYFGVGYAWEFSSSLGLDVRATVMQLNAFGEPEWDVKLKARTVSIALSLIIF